VTSAAWAAPGGRGPHVGSEQSGPQGGGGGGVHGWRWPNIMHVQNFLIWPGGVVNLKENF
jgi:hypothetical protein